uniref:Uncharacterized protein n=1 Tax=Sus scrofa TaxID=9823 RepID=A0A8D0Q2V9_PIG
FGLLFCHLILRAAIRMAKDVLDPLRQVLDRGMQSNKSYQRPWPLGFSRFCSCGFHGCTSFLGPLPHLSSFALQPVHWLLPPHCSNGTEVSQKMAAEDSDHSCML